MRKTLAVVVFLFLSSLPSFAKEHDVYPMSCDVLWASIKDALGNPRDYGVLSMDDLNLRASFVVVGNLTMYTDRVALSARDSGCAMKLTMLQVGPDYSDERGFRNRLKKAMARLQAVEPAKPANAHGQE